MVAPSSGLLKLLLLPLVAFSQVSAQVANQPEDGFVVERATTLTADQAGALAVQNNGRQTKSLTNLIWDDALAANAQAWANNLAKMDSMQHSTSAQRPNQGENLAYAYSSNGVKNPQTGGAQAWMAEAPNYHNEIIPQGNFASYGHYTQCMWKTTTRIGMANATAANGGVYTVGRYSPPGNYVGNRPY